MFYQLAILFLAITVYSLPFTHVERVSIKGKVICGDRYSVGVGIQLCDGSDCLEKVTSSSPKGAFQASGNWSVFFSSEPSVLITHNCDVENRTKCLRQTRFPIHEWYVLKEENKYDRIYDMKLVQLIARQEKDEDGNESCE
ncbi:unnamed protein product, partial [Mesorhabditis belari]|uniref:Uncharacterized protein n=1 Tax=Mesorhabditis belari TaxID=2138241 RepID=A0AAF3J564_9BILA